MARRPSSKQSKKKLITYGIPKNLKKDQAPNVNGAKAAKRRDVELCLLRPRFLIIYYSFIYHPVL